MALLPYALRPKTILRRTAIKRAVESDSIMWRALSIYFLRGPRVLRIQAIRHGFAGSTGWRAIALFAVVTQEMRDLFIRQPEAIAEEKLRPGDFLSVVAAKPLSRKEQKRTGITRKVLERQAVADVAAAKAAKSTS